jgi:hypothetical protein
MEFLPFEGKNYTINLLNQSILRDGKDFVYSVLFNVLPGMNGNQKISSKVMIL